jgi:hypothetical protein
VVTETSHRLLQLSHEFDQIGDLILRILNSGIDHFPHADLNRIAAFLVEQGQQFGDFLEREPQVEGQGISQEICWNQYGNTDARISLLMGIWN